MAEGQNCTGVRMSTRLKERESAVASFKVWDENSKANKVLTYLKTEQAERSVRKTKGHSKSVTGRNERSVVEHEEEDQLKGRGRSRLSTKDLQHRTAQDRECANSVKAEQKRAKSLSRSQQWLDLLWFRNAKCGNSNYNSDKEISFHPLSQQVLSDTVVSTQVNCNKE